MVLESAKLTQYVKFQMVLVWNVHSHYTHHVLLKLKWFATVKYVVQNFTTYAHYTEKRLVSKKSEDKHGKLPWKSEICEKSLYIKGFSFTITVLSLNWLFWIIFIHIPLNCPRLSDFDYQCRQNRAKFRSQFDDKFNTKNTKTFTEFSNF